METDPVSSDGLATAVPLGDVDVAAIAVAIITWLVKMEGR